MKKHNKIITTVAAIATLASVVAPLGDAFAASTPTWADNASSYTIVRSIPNAYGSINNTFSYTITADENNPAGATGAPTSASITFNQNYTTQTNATQSTVVNFNSMQFDRVGDYNFVIRETNSTDQNIYPIDSTNVYTATVSVRNNADLTSFVASFYIKDSGGYKLEAVTGSGSQVVFASTPSYTNIQISETVSGNTADPNKCFEYRLNLGTSDSYVVSTESTCGNPDTIGDGGIIKLKHNDTMTIGLVRAGSQIPVGTEYSITKAGAAEGYTTKMDNVERTTISKTMVATGDSSYNTANKTAINEYLEKTVDTNAFMNITIYVLLALAGAMGIYYVSKKKSSRKA